MKPLDVAGILERAGADASAPVGSQAWALAQVAQAVEALRTACRHFTSGMPLQYQDNAAVVGNSNALEIENMRIALARFEATP